ncbi:MAG TPA: type II CAAX endopeptidase family protein [Prolixibacteraceae bacterium]|nr:type II CAAX endopeptidase family protein [Prolixibacteraceae bacterium]
MAYTVFRGMKPFPQLMFSFFVILVSVVVFSLVSIILAIPFFGMNSLLSGLSPEGMTTPEGLALLKYFQVVQSIGIFILPPLVLGYLFQGNIRQYLKMDRSASFNTYLYTGLSILVLVPLINFAGELNNQMSLPESMAGLEEWMRTKEETAKVLTEKFLHVETIPALLFNIFMVAVLAALGEEFLFRGVIQRIFTTMTRNYHWGIWITAILFSAVHIQFYGFLPRMLLGAMFGYMLVWTGTMWVPVLAHFVNNTMGVIGYYLMHKGLISDDVEQWGTGSEQYPILTLSLVLSSGLLYLIYRSSDQTKMPANHLDSQAPRID